MKTTKNCVGCYNNFYNGRQNFSTKNCWNLPDAKMETRFEISVNAPMGSKRNYRKRKLPSCYQATGFVYLKDIPSYAE